MKPNLNLNTSGQRVIQDVISQLTPSTIMKIDNLFRTVPSVTSSTSSQYNEDESWDSYQCEETTRGSYMLSGGSATLVKEEPVEDEYEMLFETAPRGKRHWNADGSQDVQPKKRQRRGNMKDDYDGLSPEDRERLVLKRERNKQAAARCRQRREDLIQTLSDKVKKNETEKARQLKEIQDLRQQKMALEELLNQHKASGCHMGSGPAPAVNQPAPIKFARPMSLDIPTSTFSSVLNNPYPIDTPQSRLNAFDNISTGMTPTGDFETISPFRDIPYLTYKGKSMAVL